MGCKKSPAGSIRRQRGALAVNAYAEVGQLLLQFLEKYRPLAQRLGLGRVKRFVINRVFPTVAPGVAAILGVSRRVKARLVGRKDSPLISLVVDGVQARQQAFIAESAICITGIPVKGEVPVASPGTCRGIVVALAHFGSAPDGFVEITVTAGGQTREVRIPCQSIRDREQHFVKFDDLEVAERSTLWVQVIHSVARNTRKFRQKVFVLAVAPTKRQAVVGDGSTATVAIDERSMAWIPRYQTRSAVSGYPGRQWYRGWRGFESATVETPVVRGGPVEVSWLQDENPLAVAEVLFGAKRLFPGIAVSIQLLRKTADGAWKVLIERQLKRGEFARGNLQGVTVPAEMKAETVHAELKLRVSSTAVISVLAPTLVLARTHRGDPLQGGQDFAYLAPRSSSGARPETQAVFVPLLRAEGSGSTVELAWHELRREVMPLLSGRIIEVEFLSPDTPVTQLSILCASYGRSTQGRAVIEIVSGDRNLSSTEVSLNEIADNSWLAIPLAGQTLLPRQWHRLRIIPRDSSWLTCAGIWGGGGSLGIESSAVWWKDADAAPRWTPVVANPQDSSSCPGAAIYQPTVSVISVLYRKAPEVRYFLEALARQSYQGPLEVIFVDDASPDNSTEIVEEWLRSHPGLNCRVMKNEKNLGNCGSRNKAIAQATGDIVVVVDADCMLNSTCIESHVSARRFGDFDVVVGAYNIESGVTDDPLAALQRLEESPEKTQGLAELQDPINKNSFLNCITRNFSIRRSCIIEPLFDDVFAYSEDPQSGFGWEDVEMGYRLYQRGVSICYAPTAFSVHISHPSTTPENTKAVRSLKNFRRLIQKHPACKYEARRWVLDTYQKICRWLDAQGRVDNADRRYLDQELLGMRFRSVRPAVARPLRILSYRWHPAHQYELYKLPHQFTLAQGLGLLWTGGWDYASRPLRENVTFAHIGRLRIEDFDCAILHFDENSITPENTHSVVGHDWGNAFLRLRELTLGRIPSVAICHGTVPFYGQFDPEATGPLVGKLIESERRRMVEFLEDIFVVTNSYEAASEWGFVKGTTIWQGFDPMEFPQGTYQRGILTLGRTVKERPVYRGLKPFNRVKELLQQQGIPMESLKVQEPHPRYDRSSNEYAVLRFRAYVDAVRQYSVYFNPTLRSPMPRSRGEAMMCGLVPVSMRNHDVELFTRHGYDGFYGDTPEELAEYLSDLAKSEQLCRQIGARARAVAQNVFNHDRFLQTWQGILREVTR